MKKTFLIPFLSLIIFCAFVAGSSFVYAQIGGKNTGDIGGTNTGEIGGSNSTVVKTKIDNPFQEKIGNSLFSLMKAIINEIILPIGGVLAVLAFIYSGFLYVTAQGDTAQIKTAHTALLYTAVGTAALLGSWVLANVICQTIGQLGGPICPV